MTQLSTRDQIIIVCRELVQEKGYESLNLSDIAKRLNLRRQSLYHHFENKETMVIATIVSYRNTFSEILKQIEKQKIPRKCLEGLIDAYSLVLEPNNKRVCLCVSLIGEKNTLPKSIQEELKKFVQLQVDWVVKIFQDDNPITDSEAKMIIASLQGSMDLARLENGSKTFKSLAYSLLENFLISHEKTGMSRIKKPYNGTD